MDPTKVSHDSLFDGKLHCLQGKDGYRFSVDAVLLAHFISPKPGEMVLDLGAGCGVISLILAYRFQEIHLTSLEIQEFLASLIAENINRNGFQKTISLIQGDFCEIARVVLPESFDQLVCNPPYYCRKSGRQNPGAEEAKARHEISSSLADVVAATFFSLRNRGKASFIYPASRGAVLLTALKNNRLEPKKIQFVYSYPSASAKLILVEVVKNGGEELEVLAPFYIFDKPGGEYTKEMAACYAA